MRTHLVWSDRHVTPGVDSTYHDWIAKLIIDLKPDVVVDNGDGADMASLCSYDRGTRSFQGRTYVKDIEAANEANDRIWSRVKKQKKRLPFRVTTIGNHERRIFRAQELSPELTDAISYKDLQLEHYYDLVVDYDGATPGSVEIDGVHYAHYFVSGVKGLPIGGEHPATTLVLKNAASSTVGHSHVLDFSRRVGVDGRTRLGLVTGWCGLHRPSFAGASSHLWWAGVVIKRNVENGNYNPEFVSLERLRQIYGK